jgi:hypothetical protein
MDETNEFKNVNHPEHYNWLKAHTGIEAITLCELFNFNRGNALKYIIRAGKKGDGKSKEIEDLRKAQWYIQREIQRIEKEE